MQVSQRYGILSLLQALLGGAIAVTVFTVYTLYPSPVSTSSLMASIGGLGALSLTYYLTAHQLLKRHHLKLSAVLLSVLTAFNTLLVILATGGLDSPYYALWLLGIVVAGVFGTIATAVMTMATLIFYAYEFWRHWDQSGYVVGHLGQLAIILSTAGIAEWIHAALGRNNSHAKVEELSGQLDQEALKSSVLMESVDDGILVVNAAREIQLFNPAATRMTGWDERSAKGIDYRLVLNLHDESGNKVSDEADPFSQMLLSAKSLVRNDLTVQTKGGHSIAISLSFSPIYDSDKKVNGAIALFRDISQEKEVERQRDEFISTASHEMRTPVAAIEGYLSLAMNPAVATVDDRAKGYLEKAHASTQHLGELFRDLLSITKMEDSAKMDKQEVFDLTQLVKEAVGDMQFTAQKKSLELQFGTDAVLGGREVLPQYAVLGNQQRIREVLNNLMENAIKFTPQGRVRVSISGTKDTVTVSVIDSGIGISEEDISHLFQKFYRIDSSDTRTIGGTGLGLYLCRTIIELLGGKIWVESKLREGSAFKFSLPRQDSGKLMAASPEQPASAGTSSPTAATSTQPTTTLTDIAKPIGVK